MDALPSLLRAPPLHTDARGPVRCALPPYTDARDPIYARDASVNGRTLPVMRALLPFSAASLRFSTPTHRPGSLSPLLAPPPFPPPFFRLQKLAVRNNVLSDGGWEALAECLEAARYWHTVCSYALSGTARAYAPMRYPILP
eukprot:753428-Rhodomonas_salina.1